MKISEDSEVPPRVRSLCERHQRLEAKIKDMSLRPGHCSVELRGLKVLKLGVKDELAELGYA